MLSDPSATLTSTSSAALGPAQWKNGDREASDPGGRGQDAGSRELTGTLLGHRGEDLVVLGLPRGGVPVAYEVAMALEAPLDVIVVRTQALGRVPARIG